MYAAIAAVILRVVASSRLAVLWRNVSAAPDWVFCNLKIDCEWALNSCAVLVGQAGLRQQLTFEVS